MDAKIPEWVGNGVSNTPSHEDRPPEKNKRQSNSRITLQRVKDEWKDCTIIDAFDPDLVDWLIARVEILEKRLAKHRGDKNGQEPDSK